MSVANTESAPSQAQVPASASAPASTPATSTPAAAPATPAAQPASPSKPAVTLAPAPVPQATPWKSISATPSPKSGIELLDTPKKPTNAAQQRAREPKRSTTGKEKWVVITPAPEDISSNQHANANQSSNSRPRTNNKRQQGTKRRTNTRGNSRDGSNSNHNGNGNNNRSRQRNDDDKQEKNDDKRKHYDQRSNGSSGETGNANDGNASSNGYRNKQRNGAPRPGHQVPYYPAMPMMPGMPGMPGMPVPGMVPAMPIPGAGVYENAFTQLVAQLNYYFSVENLCKDLFLRRNMDDNGFVPISFIAGFNRIRALAQSADIVAQALLNVPNAEVQGGLVRPVHQYERWVMPRESRVAEAQVENHANITPTSAAADPASAGASAPVVDVEFRAESATPFVPKTN